MHRYQVLQITVDCDQVVLSDDQGRHHLARAIRCVPEIGTPLRGTQPALGFGVLTDAENQRTFKLIFEQLDCESPKGQMQP
jgi:hypothetical protein